MSDTCIVCLGDLGEGGNFDLTAAELLPRLEDNLDSSLLHSEHNPTIDVGKLAHLLPCGHHLHNDCLKPWVERANSCPICRRNFNIVELVEKIGGPVTSSYVVEDRVQVADIDPSMIVDELIEESDFHPCPICSDDDNEDVLMICDGCEVASHTYCVGLDAVPAGEWFCAECEAQRSYSAQPATRPAARSDRRTRSDVRRTRSRNQMHAFHWARVWQSVWDQLNIDLDFPFDDEQAADRILRQRRRDASNQREFRAWERRFRVADRQGAPNRFRDTAPVLLEMRRGWPSRPRQRIETPEPESLDEIRAWNAFERARDIEGGPEVNRRKRKSPTASPTEPEPAQPERRFKRPRTKRPEALADMHDQAGESSSRGRLMNGGQGHTSLHSSTSTTSGPSFLQGLLKEVEESSTPNSKGWNPSTTSANPADMSSSAPSSPALSPISSSRSSSRPPSATPLSGSRRNSRARSASSEVYFSSPEFSPSRSPAHERSMIEEVRASRSRVPPSHSPNNSPSRRSRPGESSPTRLSRSIKSDLQKMVSAVLKPFYRRKQVSKEEYTDINRRISRLLYDQVEVSDSLDAETKSKLAVIASDEVTKAVSVLRELRTKQLEPQQLAVSE